MMGEGKRRLPVMGHIAKKAYSDEDERDSDIRKMANAKQRSGYSEIDKPFTVSDYDKEFAAEG